MEKNRQFLTTAFGVASGAILSCALWGSAFPGIKLGYRFFRISSEETATQILFAGCRFVLAGILTILIASVMNGRFMKPKKTSWRMVGMLSAFQTVIQYMLFYIGLAHASGVKSSIIEGSNVFLAILVSCFVFRQEKLTRRKLLGCVLGFAGVVLVNWSENGMLGAMVWNGEGFIFLSALSYAFSASLIRKYSTKENSTVLSGYQFLIGGLVMVLFGLLLGGRFKVVNMEGMMMLAYLSMVSAVAYSIWAALLKHNPVSRVSVFGFTNPVFGVILSALLLREGASDLGMRAVCALLLICAGIYIVNARDRFLAG